MSGNSTFDRLAGQDARVRTVSRMMPLTGPLSPTLQAEIRKALADYMRANELTQGDVADAIGQSATYVNNLLTNASSLPVATRDRMLRDINNWLEREARAAESQRPDDFVRTKVADRMIATAEQLTNRADMAIAYGPAGIGKSTVIEAIVAEIPTAVAITAGHDTRTAVKLLATIYQALTKRRRAASRGIALEDVADRLRMPPRVRTRSLLIIDQAHTLPPRAWPVLMELHDKAQCSVLLVGTIDLKRHAATDDDPEFGQLSSRIGLRIALAPELSDSLTGGRASGKCFMVVEIRKLFARSKLKLHSDAARMLCQIANTRRGTLRRVCRLFDWAERAATKAGADTITVEHVRAAATVVEVDFELPAEQSATEVQEATA